VLRDPQVIRDHLEFVIDRIERQRWAVWFVLCDERDRVLVHCPLEEVPADCDLEDCVRAVWMFANMVRHLADSGAMLVVVTRPGAAEVCAQDRQWFRVAHEQCRRLGVRLLGVHLLTPDEHRVIAPEDGWPM
jgi:hypothetical protein